MSSRCRNSLLTLRPLALLCACDREERDVARQAARRNRSRRRPSPDTIFPGGGNPAAARSARAPLYEQQRLRDRRRASSCSAG